MVKPILVNNFNVKGHNSNGVSKQFQVVLTQYKTSTKYHISNLYLFQINKDYSSCNLYFFECFSYWCLLGSKSCYNLQFCSTFCKCCNLCSSISCFPNTFPSCCQPFI